MLVGPSKSGTRLVVLFVTSRSIEMKKLFVGNLPYEVTDADLKNTFSQAGTVAEAIVILDKQTKNSKGFGFVSFENDAEADAAIDMWNGKDMGGRSLTVNEARPKVER